MKKKYKRENDGTRQWRRALLREPRRQRRRVERHRRLRRQRATARALPERGGERGQQRDDERRQRHAQRGVELRQRQLGEERADDARHADKGGRRRARREAAALSLLRGARRAPVVQLHVERAVVGALLDADDCDRQTGRGA